jgi:hypothetical protein
MIARIAFPLLAAASLLLPAAALADAAYRVEAPAASARANVPGATTVVVKPGKGYHFNRDYPTSLKLEANPEVAAPARLTRKDDGVKVAEDGASFEVKFTARSAGRKTVSGTLSFAVCTATTCDPRKEQVTLLIDVKP